MAKNMTKAQMAAQMAEMEKALAKANAELKAYDSAARTTKARTTTSNDFVFVYEVDGGAFLRVYVRVPGPKGRSIRYAITKGIKDAYDRTPKPVAEDFKSAKAFKNALAKWEKAHPKYRYTSTEVNGEWVKRSASVPAHCYVLTSSEYKAWIAAQKKAGRNWTVVKDLREIDNLH